MRPLAVVFVAACGAQMVTTGETRPDIVTPCNQAAADPSIYLGAPYMNRSVFPGDSPTIATVGFSIHCDGIGGYRLAWEDPSNAATCFAGLVTGSADFDRGQVGNVSGYEAFTVVADDQIAFSSVPGNNLDGLTFQSTMDPVLFVVTANGVPGSIYFTDDSTRQVDSTLQSPASFSCP